MELTVGQKIKRAREFSGVKQDVIAEKLGISQASYSKIESNETDVTISRLQKIAEILELDVADIIGFDQKMFINKNQNNNITYLTNSNFNDLDLIRNLLDSKDKTIAALEAQIALLLKNK